MVHKEDRTASPERRTFGRGTTIFKEGDPGDCAFVLERGEIEIAKTMYGKTIRIGSVPQWGIFGELGALDGAPRMASAIAVRESVCLIIRRDTIAELLADAPQGLTVLVQTMANTIRHAGDDLAQARYRLTELGQPL